MRYSALYLSDIGLTIIVINGEVYGLSIHHVQCVHRRHVKIKNLIRFHIDIIYSY